MPVRMFRPMKQLHAVALVLVLVVVGCKSSDGQATPSRTPAATAQASGDSAAENDLLERADAGRIQGAPNAPIWLVEISDFQCPFCKQWHDETYPLIKREYIDRGQVRMAYVNLPIASIHRHAAPAAEAAMCASAQGRFWPVHDAIFATQGRWNKLDDATAVFDSLVIAAGVKGDEFRGCMRSQVMRRVLNGDRQRAAAAGVTSTPVFFVGDEMIRGAAPITEFRAAIERARAKTAARPSP
jgi:protein-disulfide isomerase